MTRKIISITVLLSVLFTLCVICISCKDKDGEDVGTDSSDVEITSDEGNGGESTSDTAPSNGGVNNDVKDDGVKDDNGGENTEDTQKYGNFHFNFGK